MRFEIRKHWNKLIKISKLTTQELEISYEKKLANITFINEELISIKNWHKAELLDADIDIDDIDFVALTSYLEGGLWTGDNSLYSGLRAKRFRSVYNTQDLTKLRNRLSNR